jgi:hypothetical protein
MTSEASARNLALVGQLEAAGVDEAEVRLVDQLRGVDRAFDRRTEQPAVRQLAQRAVHEGHEPIAGALVPRAPSPQEVRDLGRVGCHRSFR